MNKDSRIYVAGMDTLIGSALRRKLQEQGYFSLIDELELPVDLTDQDKTIDFFSHNKPEYVFVAAGRSGGIVANKNYPAEIMRNNLQVIANIMHSAYRHKVKKLLYVASSCCYPRECPQPIREDYLLTGPFEPTNDAYSAAKVAGIKMCQAYRQQYGMNFISVIPPNLFGLGDDFHPEDSHVIAALIRKMHEAKEQRLESVGIWGTGTPRREFIFVDDFADACLFLMNRYDQPEHINAGGGKDLSIRELAMHIKEVVGYPGELSFDASKPDGMPIKLLDSSRLLDMGWQPKTDFSAALTITYHWFLKVQQGLKQTVSNK